MITCRAVILLEGDPFRMSNCLLALFQEDVTSEYLSDIRDERGPNNCTLVHV